jgi:hypothetical protein
MADLKISDLVISDLRIADLMDSAYDFTDGKLVLHS